MLLSSCALKSLNSIEKINLRMIHATFDGNLYTTIISYYSPTHASDETVIITFCNKLSSLVRHIFKHDFLIISGDMNTQNGKDKNNKFCLHNLSSHTNRNISNKYMVTLRNKLDRFLQGS